MRTTEIAIVGAGPYGLSLAAHLRHRGLDFRIFGQPMDFWLKMIQGSRHRYLKSFGFGTNIYTPEKGYSFVEYCLKRGVESFEPCAMSDFANYGLWVQQNAIPNVERVDVSSVSRVDGGYHLTLANGDELLAKQVVIATGLTSFAVHPTEFSHLPKHLVSHTSEISDFSSMAGHDICIVGAGQSALEAAALLHDADARPRLLVRESQILWNKRVSQRRTLWRRLRSPLSGLGAGPKGWFLTRFPSAIHYAPDKWRVSFTARHLPAEGAWWLRDHVEKSVPIVLNCTVVGASEKKGRVLLTVRDGGTGERQLACDHVVVGTGFRVDVDRLSFLSADLRASVRRIKSGPALDRHFESSAEGLFFVGAISALSFGPLFRFVVGASYAAPSLSAHLASKKCNRSSIGRAQRLDEHSSISTVKKRSETMSDNIHAIAKDYWGRPVR